MKSRLPVASTSLFIFAFLFVGALPGMAQEVRVGAGGGYGVPTNNVEAGLESERVVLPLSIDLKPGPHGYAAAGLVRSIGDNFALGARLRGQVTRLRSTVDVCASTGRCTNPEGLLRAVTVEGRVILTSPGWIHPYLLVGLGVVHASVDAVTVRAEGGSDSFSFPEVSVADAGGDVGLGATVPLVGGLDVDAEFRVTGALPGGKENAVTVLPFSLGLAYGF